MGEDVVFWVLAPLIGLASFSLVLARKVMHVAAGMIVVMLGLAMFYFVLEAPFLGMVQIIVYTGAIMMLILFVLMLVGVREKESLQETIKGQRWIALAGVGGLAALIIVTVREVSLADRTLASRNTGGNSQVIADLIFGDWVLVVEVLALLLVVAAVGAVVLTHLPSARRSQLSVSDARVKQRLNPVNKPMPGVYARRNALDVPALGPDGRPLEASESRVLKARKRGIAGAAGNDSMTLAWKIVFAILAAMGLAAWAILILFALLQVGPGVVNPMHHVVLATILFSIGAAAVMLRKNAIVALMGVELMLNASNLLFATFARSHQDLNGQVLALLVIVVAAAEVVVGLALIIAIFRSRQGVSLDEPRELKG
jgi:NADH-quinone oxidoreductase subunit J